MVNSKWIYNPRTIIIWIIWQIHHESLQLSHCDIGYLFLICDKSSETKTLHVMYYVFAYWLINIFVTLLKMHIFACWCHISLQMINRMFTSSWKNSVWERERGGCGGLVLKNKSLINRFFMLLMLLLFLWAEYPIFKQFILHDSI